GRDTRAAHAGKTGRAGRPVQNRAVDRAGRRARCVDERAAAPRRHVALPHRPALSNARCAGGGGGPGARGAQHAAARRGGEARHHRPGGQPSLAPLLRRHRARRRDRRHAHRVRWKRADSLSMARDTRPVEQLSIFDGIVLICGMVIGAGIFKAPSIVAANTSSGAQFIFAWIRGGAVSLCGALVYAELAARYPETGGEYAFLSRGWGRGVAFVFAWARMTVIQTGAIAAVSFVFGDYASEIFRLGEKSSAIYAAIGVAGLTALNVAGTLESKLLQRLMQVALFAGLLYIALAGLLGHSPHPASEAASGG